MWDFQSLNLQSESHPDFFVLTAYPRVITFRLLEVQDLTMVLDRRSIEFKTLVLQSLESLSESSSHDQLAQQLQYRLVDLHLLQHLSLNPNPQLLP